MALFSFPADARWNTKLDAVEFGIGLGEYQGVVRVDRRVFRHLLGEPATPARCIELYHLQRTEFERAAEEKLRRRELADDGNIELTGRDLRRGSGGSRQI
jgi:hypothetical protein